MAKHANKVTPPATPAVAPVTPASTAPVVPVVLPTAAQAKPAKRRYALPSAIANTALVIVQRQPGFNPKQQGSAAHARYAYSFCGDRANLQCSVADYLAHYQARYGRHEAGGRADLRWNIAHGFMWLEEVLSPHEAS